MRMSAGREEEGGRAMEKSRIVGALSLSLFAFAFVCCGEDSIRSRIGGSRRRWGGRRGLAGAAGAESEEHPDEALDAIGDSRRSDGGGYRGRGGVFHVAAGGARGAVGHCLRGGYPAGDAGPATEEYAGARGCECARRCWGRSTIRSCRRTSLDLVLLVDVYHEFSEPERAGSDSGVAEAGWTACVSGISGRGSEVPIKPEHEMTRQAGAGRSATGGIPIRQGHRGAAATAHHHFQKTLSSASIRSISSGAI